jgi:3-oxocholest-4-en-26-oyl-CoA dehydrogenase beta subunit
VPIDLELNETQRQLQQSAHDFFMGRCPSSVVREIEAGELGYEPAMWRAMADLGWLGITFPEQYGGAGGTFLDLYPICEEMGRFLVPSPLLDTVALVGDVVLAAGNEAQKAELLPTIAEGRCIVSPAILEASGTYGSAGITMPAKRSGGSFVLTGTKLLVGFASSADHLLCAARTSGENGSEGVTLFLVDPSSRGISWNPLSNLAGGALYEVVFDDVAVSTDRVVGDVDGGWRPLSNATTKAAVLQTIIVLGAARSVLDMTNQYAKDRVQFGSPIGRYQAVQYMVTDILLALHNAELLAKQAAYKIDADKPFGREAAIAIAYGKQAAAHLHRQAHEVHAGVGFILDHDLTLFSRRSKFWEYNFGDARYYQERLAEEMNL